MGVDGNPSTRAMSRPPFLTLGREVVADYRQPGRWRERREVDVTMTLEAQIAALSPEERRQRLLELQRKAVIMIEGS